MNRVEIVAGLMVSFLLAMRASGWDEKVIGLGYRSAERIDNWVG